MWVICLFVVDAACASAPWLRSPAPLPGESTWELAPGAVGLASSRATALGPMGFAGMRSPAVDLFASAQGALLLPLSAPSPWRGLGSAQLGARTRMAFAPGVVVASEVAVDYLEDRLRLGDVRHVSGLLRLPLAQEVVPSLWVYAAPTVGLAVPVYEGPPLPFFGVAEMPVGFSWTFSPEWTLLVEGGALGGAFWRPDDGFYGGAALLFHPPLPAALTRPRAR